MDIQKLCMDMGAAKVETVPVSKLTLQRELRHYCEQNHCGLYGLNHACPPRVGDIDSLIAKLRGYDSAVFFQNVYPLEDSFDFEGMMEAMENHQDMTKKIASAVYAALGKSAALVLSAGGCTLCPACAAKSNEPCRRPDALLVSLEAYGVNVSQVGEVSGLGYINGPNTVTYFSGVFTALDNCSDM